MVFGRWQVTSSTVITDFSWFSLKRHILRQYLKIGHDCFLLNHCRFITFSHPSIRHYIAHRVEKALLRKLRKYDKKWSQRGLFKGTDPGRNEKKQREMEAGKGGTYSTNGEVRNAYEILVGKPQGKRRLGRSRCRWRIILKYILKK